MNPPGVEPILPDKIAPGKTGTSFTPEPPVPLRDNKSHTISDDPASPDAQPELDQANS